jgi:hypothetical protein
MRSLLLVLCLWPLVACKTIETWDNGLPRDGTSLATEGAKQTEYRRFVVRDVGVKSGKGYFELKDDKGEARYYAAASFYPVLKDVSPDVSTALDEVSKIREKDGYAQGAMAAGFAAALFGPTSWMRNLGSGAMAVGFGGQMVLDHMKKAELEKVMERYNADLTRRIYAPQPAKTAAGTPTI